MASRLVPCLLVVVAVLAAVLDGAPASTPSPTSPTTAAAEDDPLRKLAPTLAKVARECLSKEYNAMACWKLFLVRRADNFLGDVRTSEHVKHVASFELLPGFVALEKDARRQDNEIFDDDLEDVGGMEAKDDVLGQDLQDDEEPVDDPGRDQESLDRALIARTSKLFTGRHVSVKVLPGVALKVSPRMAKDQNSLDADVSVEVGPGFSVGRMKMKNMSPVFLLPPLMFMGMMPFMLATLKGVVIKAMMLNQMAFMSTLWMTVRDTVFGPRPIVKYYNYGYKAPRPPVHYRHPAPPVQHHQDHHVEHHHSEPVHFEHHHEEHHLPDHRIEHHVEHHETHGHGASPFFHDESGGSSSGEDYAQDLSYVGADDRNDRGHTKQVVDAEAADDEAVAMPQAAPYRRHPSVAAAPMYEARPNRLRFARAPPTPTRQ